jgi:hypothetical protein
MRGVDRLSPPGYSESLETERRGSAGTCVPDFTVRVIRPVAGSRGVLAVKRASMLSRMETTPCTGRKMMFFKKMFERGFFSGKLPLGDGSRSGAPGKKCLDFPEWF